MIDKILSQAREIGGGAWQVAAHAQWAGEETKNGSARSRRK